MNVMESLIGLRIEKLDNGEYLATSEDLPGLVAQGKSISETIDIARDVAKKLIDSMVEHGDPLPLKSAGKSIETKIAIPA